MDSVVRDLEHAIRRFRREPRFTFTALVTLALCLGANLTIFAVVDAVLLRPLPFPDAGRLVAVFNTYPNAGVERDGASVTNYYERRGHLATLASLAIYRNGTALVGESGATEAEAVARVSPDFFSTLGVDPARGRTFTDQEMTRQTDDVAILTNAYWRQRAGADPGVLGRKIHVDGAPKTVVGVLPPDFRFLSSHARVYLPLPSNAEERGPARRHAGTSTEMIARLRPGVSMAAAQAEIDAQNAALELDDPDARTIAGAGFRTIVRSLHADHVASIRPILLLTQTGVLCLLLIGAVNLVNLLLIRAAGRTRELAIRQSLGASARRIVSAVMVETVLLTVAGGLLGLMVGAAGTRLLATLGTERLPLGSEVVFDARVAGIAMLGSIALGVLIAAPIAWFNLRADPAGGLQTESRGGIAGRSAQRVRHGFVVAQIALAFVLISGAGMLALSFERAMAAPSGFQPDHVLSAHITLPRKDYQSAGLLLAFSDRVLEAASRQPGVVAVGAASRVPLGESRIKSAITVVGHVAERGESLHGHYVYSVAGDYFTALGVPLREGRYLTAADSRRDERTCVVDEDFARRYWPRASALGQQLFEGSSPADAARACTIVGVVGAVKQVAVTDEGAPGAVYFPFGHRADGSLYVLARTRRAPESFATSLRGIVRRIDPGLAVDDLWSMDARIADSLIGRRSPAVLTGIFAVMALLLAALGTYGVLSYAVAQRRREIGVRIALGAQPRQIRRQFLIIGARLLAIGATLGVLGAAAAGRAARSVLFDVPALHPATLAATAAVISAVTLVACVVPSRRAARLSPMAALSDQ
ncbi:MAG TPA: ABC transporter permease [Vicinamibacterales bacterium]|nr:ABC transporter permease [Vicinamibacterales bacterium]